MLKKDLVYRAYMALKNENALCLSSKVHDILKSVDSSDIEFVLQKMINYGELITLKQLVYYVNNLGLQLDLVSVDGAIEVAHYDRAAFDMYLAANTGDVIMTYNYELNTNVAGCIPYVVTQALGWRDAFTFCVYVAPLRDYLLATQIKSPINEIVFQFADDIEGDSSEDAVFEGGVYDEQGRPVFEEDDDFDDDDDFDFDFDDDVFGFDFDSAPKLCAIDDSSEPYIKYLSDCYMRIMLDVTDMMLNTESTFDAIDASSKALDAAIKIRKMIEEAGYHLY